MFSNYGRKGRSTKVAPRQDRRRRSARPFLEPLESRLAPALLTVNTLADETAADNFLSLREALNVVSNQSTAGLSAAELL